MKCTQVPSETRYTRTFASVSARAKVERLKPFVALQFFKKLAYFAFKVHMTDDIDMNVWVGMIISSHHPKNWIQMIVKMLSETLMKE